MPSPAYTSPFDLTFDSTFQNLMPADTSIAIGACEPPGINLHWLSLRGWCSYPFRGNSEEHFDIKSPGVFEQGGAIRDTYRTGQRQLVVRAGGLTRTQSEVISSLVLSPAVYALLPAKDGFVKAVIVHIDEGTYTVWQDASKRMNVEVNLLFPKIKSQRA